MRAFILGTDWWTDCDDAVALRLLCNAVKKGDIRLLGIGINACMEYSLASVKGFLKAEGLKDIPLGLDRAATDFGGNPPYQKRLALEYCPDAANEDAEDAVRLYRRLLAAAEEPVEILEIGFPQVLSALLMSGGDDISDKSGLTLVTEKVKKFWLMAGKWDKDGEKENNFCRNPRARTAADIFCRTCPVPVTFLGWEVGFDVFTGDGLPHSDHLYRVLLDHGSENGRNSWDPMLVLLAVIGDEEEAGYTTVSGHAGIDPQTGKNYFEKDRNGLHKYVVKARENDFYKQAINDRIR